MAIPPPPTITSGTAIAAAVAPVKGGRALLRMRCRGQGACRGAARLVVRVKAGKGAKRVRSRVRNLVIGRGRFSIPAGETKVIRLRLTGKCKALLRKAGRRGLRAKLQGSGLKSRTVKLRAKA